MPPLSVAKMLPDISNTIRISKAIAMLDAIVCEEWDCRYYSFDSKWSKGESMASMRDGCGDEYKIWFSSIGAAIKGFAHESRLSPYGNEGGTHPGVLEQLPSDFDNGFLNEAAFATKTDTTFCLWRKSNDSQWHSGNVEYPPNSGTDPDGSETLLRILDGKPATYVQYALDYFELELDESDVKHVYELKPLTPVLLTRLHATRTLKALAEDAKEIDYPQGK